jgi:hypothetical protein
MDNRDAIKHSRKHKMDEHQICVEVYMIMIKMDWIRGNRKKNG